MKMLQIFADALIFSELRFHPGQGQGVQRLPIYLKRIKNKEININVRFMKLLKKAPH